MRWLKNATRYSRLAPIYPFLIGRIKKDPLLLIRSDSNMMDIYFEEENIRKHSEDEIRKVLDGNYAEKHLADTGRIIRDTIRFSKKIRGIDIQGCPDAELSGLFSNFFLFFERFGEITTRARINALKRVKGYLARNIHEKDAESLIMEITYPQTKSLMLTEEIEFLRIAHDLMSKSRNHESIHLLQKHLDKWAWLPADWGSGKPWTVPDLKKRLKGIKDPEGKISRIYNDRVSRLNRKNRLKKEHLRSEEIIRLVEWIEVESETRLKRRFAISKLLFDTGCLFDELSRRLNIDTGLAYNLLPKEIELFLLDSINPDMEILGERSRSWVLLFDHTGERWFYGKEGEKAINQLCPEEKAGSGNVLKGTPAYKGSKVKARARIISSHDDLSRIHSGDIIVAKDTTPDFVMHLSRVKGIITEEGGITCHAAIISREFRIPCITGVKHASGILKDNDLVELDASAGIVRKIG